MGALPKLELNPQLEEVAAAVAVVVVDAPTPPPDFNLPRLE